MLFYATGETGLESPIENLLTISLVGGLYTIDDPAEAAVTLLAGALDQGCTAFDANTVRCPAAVITSFNVATRDGNDTLVLTGVDVPTLIGGGRGNDTVFGGVDDDVFLWAPVTAAI